MTSDKPIIFIIEPDEEYARRISYFIGRNPDFEIVTFSTGRECLDNLKRQPALITTDYDLPDLTCKELMAELRSKEINIPVVVISDQQNVSNAVGAIREGASEYYDKEELGMDEILSCINGLVKSGKSTTRLKTGFILGEEPERDDLSKTVLGESNVMQRVYKMMQKACLSDVPVSVYGPTGSGKELIAKAIHNHSSFKKGPFVVVNCNAIARELAESELFGHKKGAFTGASADRVGKFEEANNGTIFLDEIGDLEMSIQAKLLRVLEAKEIIKVGSSEKIKLNCRVLIASSKDLRTEIKRGNFRDDLFYRLLGLSIKIPPLRERGGDIMLLTKRFLKMTCKKNKKELLKLSEGTVNALNSYPWQGNVRELKTVIERAVLMCESDTITTKDLEFETLTPTDQFFAQEHTMEEYKYKIFHLYLQKFNNNVDTVAKKLKIGRATAFRMLKKKEF